MNFENCGELLQSTLGLKTCERVSEIPEIPTPQRIRVFSLPLKLTRSVASECELLARSSSACCRSSPLLPSRNPHHPLASMRKEARANYTDSLRVAEETL